MIDAITKAKFKLALVKGGLRYFSDFAKLHGIDCVKFNQFINHVEIKGINRNSLGKDWEKMILDYIAEQGVV